jgi:hypothetical protein
MPIAARAAALLAATSAVLHGRSLTEEADAGLALLTVAMIAGCLYCGYELLTRETVRAWVLLAVMNVAMIGVHLPMSAGHHHGAATGHAAGMPLVVAVAGAEVLLAAAVLFVRSRGLAPTGRAACQSGRHDFGAGARPAGAAGRPDDPGRVAAGP